MRPLALVLSLLLSGCGAAISSGAVRTAAPSTALVLTPAPGRPTVEISNDDFASAMLWLARDVHSPPRFGSGRLVRASFSSEPDLPSVHGQQLRRDYEEWCLQQRMGPDCLLVLVGRPGFTLQAKHELALGIAFLSLWSGLVDEVGGMVALPRLMATVTTALSTYLALWALPEPTSKGVAAALAVALWAYLGAELWNVVEGWVLTRDEVERATSFEQVRLAGERFGHRLGQKTARILVMLATASLGPKDFPSTASRLPGFERAAALSNIQGGGPSLAVLIGEARWVAVSTGGRLTVVLSSSVAMATASDGATAAATPSPGPQSVQPPASHPTDLDPNVAAAKLAEAEAADVGSRLTTDLAALERARPSLERPPPGTPAGDGRWAEYVRYFERRLGEMRAPSAEPVKPPLSWDAYLRMHSDFARGRAYQRTTADWLVLEAKQPPTQRTILKNFEDPLIVHNAGVSRPGTQDIRFADHLVIERSPVPGQPLRVETFSVKSRNLRAMPVDGWRAQVREDARAALRHYGGTLELRRHSLNLRGKPATVERVHLVYDGRFKPEQDMVLKGVIMEIRKLGVEVSFR